MVDIRRKILIATTNHAKYAEIVKEFEDLAFDFIDLKDSGFDKFDVEEDKETTWENAIKKAKFYGDKSGLLTIAEDTGFFVDFLKGAPGVKAKRYGKTARERNEMIVGELKGVPERDRGAHFETAACVYNPADKSFSVFFGSVGGRIANSISAKISEGMGYDSIFYYPPLKKIFAELSVLEKNNVSHRGKIASKIKHFLMKQYAFRQIFAPAAVIVKDGKMLMTKRRDLRPQFNNKYEFPGGGIENGESIEECLKREVKEETGYDVEILEQLPKVFTTSQDRDYQVHLILFVCKIISGKFKTADAETCGHGWFTYKEALKTDMLVLNKKSIQAPSNKKALLKYIG